MAFQQGSKFVLPRRYGRPAKKYYKPVLALLLTAAVGYIPARLTIARLQMPKPQAILTLGGRPAREVFTADFARVHPELKIWVSSGLLPKDAQAVFQAEGIGAERLNLDYRAMDTVTNFTTLVQDLQQNQIQHVYLITSDYHMPRAQAIATIVLGSHGITFTPIAVPSTSPREESWRVVRDVLRSLVWLVTGYTGADLKSE